jgi:hypothetical protein
MAKIKKVKAACWLKRAFRLIGVFAFLVSKAGFPPKKSNLIQLCGQGLI